MTLKFVKASLLDEFNKQQNSRTKEEYTTPSSTVFVANQQKIKIQSYKCGKIGHKRSGCYYNQNQNQNHGGKKYNRQRKFNNQNKMVNFMWRRRNQWNCFCDEFWKPGNEVKK